MKKAKALKRFWAFLLIFVLVTTTLGNDSLTIVASESETVTEQADEPMVTSEQDNTGGDSTQSQNNEPVEEEKPEVQEGSQESGTTASTETPAEGETTTTPESIESTEATESSTESTNSTESTESVNSTDEDTLETESTDDGEQAVTYTVTFNINGNGRITDEAGNSLGDIKAEAGSTFKFNVEADNTDSKVSVKVDGNEIGTSNGTYEVTLDGDKNVTVDFSEPETEEKEEQYTLTFKVHGNGKVSDSDDKEISSLTATVNKELKFKVITDTEGSIVTAAVDGEELTASEGVYTYTGSVNKTVDITITEPENQEKTYTLYVEHFLDTDKGSYHRADEPVALKDADFTDGKFSVAKYEFKRTGMVMASADTLSKEDFNDAGEGYAEIHYKVAEGWKIVDNGPKYRTIYLGNLDDDNPDIVPEGKYFSVTVKFSFEDGSSVTSDFSGKYLIDEDSSKNTFSIAVPKREGYKASVSDAGVTLSSDGTTLSGSYSAEGSKEINVIYKANEISYTVKHAFERANGSGYEVDNTKTQTLNGAYGELTNAAALDVAGFTAGEITDEVLNKEGIVITINYDRNTYWLTYDANGGTYVPRESGKFGQTMAVLGKTATTKIGYNFVGWYLDKELTKSAANSIVLNEDTTLYAKWEAKKVGYSIVYLAEDINGAEGNHDRYIKTEYVSANTRGNTIKAGDKIELPPSYIKNDKLGVDHYHFADYDRTVVAKADGTAEVRVYYDLNVYNFIFNVATTYGSWPNKYNVNGKISIGSGYTGDDYRFQAKYGQDVSALWPAADETSGTYRNGRETVHFYRWDSKIGTKRLVIGDDEVPKEHFNGAVRVFEAEWVRYPDVTNGYYYFEKVDSGNLTGVNKYEEDLNYRAKINYGTLTQKVIEGYTIVDKPSGAPRDTDSKKYFYYDRIPYTLEFYNGSNTPEKTQKVKYGYTLAKYDYPPTAPAGKTGFTFGGWYDNSACEGARIDLSSATMPKANLALYAKWIAPEYTVSFISENKTLSSVKVPRGETVAPAGDPSRNGYSFIGWYDAASANAKLFDFAKPITSDTKIYAHWKMNTETTYTVQYLDKATGNAVSPAKGPFKGQVGKNAAAAAEKVDGYFVENKTLSIKLSAEADKNVITFYYHKIGSVEFPYIIKYVDVDNNNEDIYSSTTMITTDNILTVTADAEKAPGYVITPTRLTKEMSMEETVEFVFECSAKSYTITYVNVDGATWNGAAGNPNPSSYKTTDKDITLVNPSKPYFRFTGWTCNVKTTEGSAHDPMNTVISTGSYGNLVFTAGWEEVFPEEQITITANTDSKKYDGKALTNSGYTFTQNVLRPGDVLTAQVTGTRTDAGTTDNIVSSYKVMRGTTDVTNKYNISIASGTLTVTARDVTLTSADDYKLYDGTDLFNHTVTVSGDGFVSGEGASYTVTGSQLEAGSSPNSFTYALNEGTKEENYNITTVVGTLEVGRNTTQIKITAASDSKKYDGTPLTKDSYVLTGNLAEGDELTVITEGSVTDAGSAVNKVKSYVIMNGETDVTKSYSNITIGDGLLTVIPRKVTLTSGSASKEYDGTALTKNTVTVSEDGFATGEGASYRVTGTQTDAGTTDNTFSYTLNEGTKAGNYSITMVEGKLEVTRKLGMIKVTAGTLSKKYDGTELTYNEYTREGTLAEGEKLVVMVDGSITDVGSVVNEVTSVKIMRGTKDVTKNYADIVKVNGTLTVEKRNVSLTSATDSKVYDGKALTNPKIEVGGDGFARGEGASYTVTGSQTEAGSSKNTFTFTLKKGTQASNYNITKTEGTLTVTPTEEAIIVTADSVSKKYDGTPLTDSDFTYAGNLQTGDRLVVTIVGSITNVGEAENTITEIKVMNGTDDVTDSYKTITAVSGTLKVTARDITLTSASDTKVYDGNPLENDEVTVSGDGFVKGEGADFNVTGTQTEAGSSPNAFTYTLKEGTKTENYNISKVEGQLTVTKNLTDIKIKAADATKKYDGTALSLNEYSRTGGLVEGDTLTVMVAGSITDAGKADNVVTSVKVMRGSVDVTESYGNITTEKGTLEVTAREVTLTSASDSKVYDGKELTNSTVTVGKDGFVTGEGASYKVTGSQTEAGSTGNTFTYTLNRGTKEGNYSITKIEGVLEVTKNMAAIHVVAGSYREKYDGTPLTSNTYSTVVQPVEGDKLIVILEGSITDVGTTENVVKDVKVMRGYKDVTDSYGAITTENGKLEVIKREVTFTSASDSKEYDGTPLTNDLVETSQDGFVKGEGADFNVTGTQTYAGTSENTFTYTLTDKTKADNYDITTVPGILEVTNNRAEERIITITAASETKPYDGTPLVNNTAAADEKQLAKTDVLQYTVEGSQTTVGSSANKVVSASVMNGEEDVTDYYTIVTVDGTLKVTGSITYNENGGSGNVPSDMNAYDFDADITLMGAGELYREKAVFLGWSEDPTGLVESQAEEDAANILGSTIKMGETNIVVYAVWAIDENGPEGGTDEIPDYKEYPITYNGNGGSGSVVDTNIYPVGYDVTLLANGFTYSGQNYTGWGIDAAGTTVYQPGAILSMVEDGLTVYAQWTAVPPTPTPTPDPTPDTPTPGGTTTTPTATTAVLGEAFAPVQPEVGVLGEALAPEVGVLGESKGPGTGDTSPIAGWSFLIMGAALTLGITAKRRKKEEEQ